VETSPLVLVLTMLAALAVLEGDRVVAGVKKVGRGLKAGVHKLVHPHAHPKESRYHHVDDTRPESR